MAMTVVWSEPLRAADTRARVYYNALVMYFRVSTYSKHADHLFQILYQSWFDAVRHEGGLTTICAGPTSDVLKVDAC